MIVRILGRGQVLLPANTTATLTMLDHKLMQAVEADDAGAYASSMAELHALIQAHGTPVPDAQMAVSDFAVPESETTLDETHAMLLHGDLAALPVTPTETVP